MSVFYYICPNCNSRAVRPSKDHTSATCVRCGHHWDNPPVTSGTDGGGLKLAEDVKDEN